MGDIFSIISKKFNRLFADFKLENNANKSEKKYGVRSDRNDGPNGEIDESIFQKNTGDCWLLASVLSLNESKKGKEMLKNAISKNENGNWEVYFNGLDKSYEVTQEQLDKYNKKPGVFYSKYTTGDDDMLLIELATEKLIKE